MKADPSVLGDLARVFLRLGATTFGGPAVHLAVFRETLVRDRGWVDEPTYTRWLGLVQLIPGPNSSEMAMLIGRHRAGWPGLIVAGATFVLPGALLLGLLALVYQSFGTHPAGVGALQGLRPVMLAVVVDVLRQWLPEAAYDGPTRLLAATAAGTALLGVPELPLLLGGGVALACVRAWQSNSRSVLPAIAPIPATASATPDITPWQVPWPFLKVGALLFGSGYVVIGLLHETLVERLGWLTYDQLVDAFALTLATPGPILGTASFLGMLIAGPAGAALATLGIFLPAFVVVGTASALVPRIEAIPGCKALLEGVGVASLGLLAATALGWLPTLTVHPASAVWAVVAFLLLATRRVGPGLLFWVGCIGGILLDLYLRWPAPGTIGH